VAIGMVAALLCADTASAEVWRANVSDAGAEGLFDAGAVSSADGRRVAFQSADPTIVPGDFNGVSDIFVHDRASGLTRRVSVPSPRGGEGNLASTLPAISADGNRVAFISAANNLIGDDTNGATDTFVVDLNTGAIQRVNVGGASGQGGPAFERPAISADGSFVAFSDFGNLTFDAADTDPDVYVRNIAAGTNRKVSLGTGSGARPSISGDGSVVAFETDGGLVTEDTNGGFDIYADLAGKPVLVSARPDGAPGTGRSQLPALSADGDHVAFQSVAADLVPGDANGVADVFVRDIGSTRTELVSVGTDGSQPASGSRVPSISGDGDRVAFTGPGELMYADPPSTTAACGTQSAFNEVFIRDRGRGVTYLASRNEAGVPANLGAGETGFVSLSPSGGVLAFESPARNLVANDANNATDAFATDVAAAPTDPIMVTVTDAEATEGTDRFLTFNVSVCRPRGAEDTEFKLGWATVAASATAELDFPDSSNGIVFGPGQTTATIRVPVIDDDLDEGGERMFLSLDADPGVVIVRPRPRGRIADDDSAPPGPGPIVFERGDDLMKVDSTPGSTPAPLLPAGSGIRRDPAISRDGLRVAYIQDSELRVAGIDGSGDAPLVTPPSGTSLSGPSWSPGGEQIAYIATPDGLPELRIVDVATGEEHTVLDGVAGGLGETTSWSPDDTRIAFTQLNGRIREIATVDVDTLSVKPLRVELENSGNPAYSRDGKIAFERSTASDGQRIAVLEPGVGESPFEPATPAAHSDLAPYFSPDGKAIVFQRSENAGEFFLDRIMSAPLSDPDGFNTHTDPFNDRDPAWGADTTNPILNLRNAAPANEADQVDGAVFPIALSKTAPGPITVNWQLRAGGQATAPDFTATSGTVTLPKGSVRGEIPVPIDPDALDEIDEAFEIRITSVSGAFLRDAVGAGSIVDDDLPPAIDLVTPPDAVEGDPLAFAARLSAPSGRQVQVTLTTDGGIATPVDDYTARTATLTFTPGETEKPLAVTTIDDAVDEGDETVRVLGSAPVNATIRDGAAVGRIVDNDVPTVSVRDASSPEGDPLGFVVELSSPAINAARVHLATSDGTAVAPGDFAAVNDVIVRIPAGRSSATVNVATVEETLFEFNETLTATLSAPTEAAIADGTATGTIANDDTAPTVSVGDATVTEGSDLRFPVTLSAASGRPVRTVLSTADDTAVAPGDYAAQSAVAVNIPAGATTRDLVVPTAADSADEPAERLTAGLDSATGATLADDTATGTITDDDATTIDVADAPDVSEGGTLSFAVTLANPEAAPVTVQLATEDRMALAGADYTARSATLTFNPGVTERVFAVTTRQDDISELTERLAASATLPTGNAQVGDGVAVGDITDDDPLPRVRVLDDSAPEGEALEFEVTMDRPSSRSVGMVLGTGPDSGTDPAEADDFTARSGVQVTIRPGELAGMFRVATTEDETAERNETLGVTMTPAGATATVLDGAAVGTIVDDDPLPQLRIGDADVGEGGNMQLPITVSRPSSRDITVHLATSDGTAAAPGDYTAKSAPVTVPANATSATFSVQTIEDALSEDDETLGVTLSAPSANAVIGDGSGTGTILDDDGAPQVTVGNAQVREGGVLRFPVRSDRRSSRPQVVTLSTANGTAGAPGDYAARTVDVTIPAGQTEAFLDVQTVQDALDEANETVRVGAATGTIVDDDATVTIDDAEIAEGGVLRFTVRLSKAVFDPVTVHLKVRDGSAQGFGDYVYTEHDVVIPAGQTSAFFDVPTATDVLREGPETVEVVAEPGGTATGTIGDQGAEDDALPPIQGENIVAFVQGDGSVRAKLPGKKKFKRIVDPTVLPVGTQIDARKGQVDVTIETSLGDQTATFYDGVFKIQQTSTVDLATMKLSGKELRRCPSGRQATTSRRRTRRLWGRGRGSFRTRGRYSSATVSGTWWLTEDRCDRTITKVREGVVTVRDHARKKDTAVEAGEKLVVKRRR